MSSESTVRPVPVAERASAVNGETTILCVLWLTYGAFYFCRTNISAAVPGMGAELGYSKAQIGMVLGALKLAYGVGQFINGQLAEQFSARRLLAIGMLGSAALNVVFGTATGLYFLVFVWACNGYCQSLGWTPCMRVAANWFPVSRRGRAIGIIGTGYQATAAVTFIVAGQAAERLGWRGALYVPAILLAMAAVYMLVFLREAPSEEPDGTGDAAACRTPERGGTWLENVLVTLSNPALWLLAVALALLNACRYGFLDWGLTHLTEVQGRTVGKAALDYAILPVGGIAGSLVAGWATDRIFGGRRAPVICGLLVLLGLLTLTYDAVVRTGFIGTVLLLVAIGFAIYGPQVLLVGTAPADLARGGTSAAAAGFVNCTGYLGAFAGDQVTGYLAGHHGWQTAVTVWAVWAFVAAAAVAFLWNATAQRSSDDQRRP